MPGSPDKQGWEDFPAPEFVTVDLPSGGKSGVEARGGSGGTQYAEFGGEDGVQGRHPSGDISHPDETGGLIRIQFEMNGLSEGMDARIGTTRGMEHDPTAHDAGHCRLEDVLDSSSFPLALPSTEGGAVIGD
jgi:hypothetical protein